MDIETVEEEIAAVSLTGTGLKITVARDELVQKLGIVSRAVSTRGTVQVLSGILLSATDGALTVAATDMELSLRATLEAQVEGEGAVVIPGKPLVDLARLLPETEVTLEYKPQDGTVQIVSGSYTSRLHVFNAEDFPRLPAVDAQLHAIDRDALLETIDRVARSASRDESRPVLTGILVRFEAGKLVMVATDSYRLSVKETQLGESAPELEAIIPARALTELSRLAGGDTVELGVHENHVVFGTGEAWLTTRRIDGQFPNYKQLLPGDLRGRADAPEGGARRRRSPRLRARAPQLAAPSALRGGRADGLRADAGRGRDTRVATRRLLGRRVRDRLQRGVPARRSRVDRRRRRAGEADQSAAARDPRGRGRRLHAT